jgi:DnaK suppressor protein
MTKNEINKFREILKIRVVELERSTGRRDVISIERTADALDQRLRAVEREFAVRSLEAESRRLREARLALERIEDGTFGTCTECEEPVSASRLKAVPWAALCIRCQETVDCRCAASSARPMLAMAA